MISGSIIWILLLTEELENNADCKAKKNKTD
jgi:hypothetical protein